MARRTIDHFMWGFQYLFRSNLETTVKTALQSVGAGVGPRAYLVGLRAEPDARFDWCIEPETEPIAQASLAGVDARAVELYEAHEESRVFNTDPGLDAARHADLRDRMRAEALCEALQASPAGVGYRFFAGRSARIGPYDVYPVLAMVASRWDRLPSLRTRRRDRFDVFPSLHETIVRRTLFEAWSDLSRREPPRDVRAESVEIVRTSARHFVESIAMLTGQWMVGSVYQSIEAVAAQPYEGRSGVGTIVLASNGADVELDVAFAQPTPLRAARAFRKTLEMSGPDLHLLCDGEKVYGLGRTSSTYAPDDETVFAATVIGRGSWQLSHAGQPLLQVDDGRPRLPGVRLEREQFADTVERLFPEAAADDVEALWGLAEGASAQEHGTMLVVHRRAAEEAVRLAPQALAITPVRLAGTTLRSVTNIDGAVLVAPDAKCHAVGVILDGQATGDGDPARGARYNSAVRYRAAAGQECLVIIVSEDGSIDLLPHLRPRVTRSRIEQAVRRLENESRGQVDLERFWRANQVVETLEFYLNADQCTRVDQARERSNEHRQIQILRKPLRPDPEMNDSYLLDDDEAEPTVNSDG